jgi:hypothetical protein
MVKFGGDDQAGRPTQPGDGQISATFQFDDQAWYLRSMIRRPVGLGQQVVNEVKSASASKAKAPVRCVNLPGQASP